MYSLSLKASKQSLGNRLAEVVEEIIAQMTIGSLDFLASF